MENVRHPEQKEEWRDRFESRGFTSAIKKASDFNQHQYDLMVNEMGYFMSQELALAEESGRIEEVRLFMEHIQKKADTVPPNLLLNEVVNYAYDRIKTITQKS